MMTTAILKPLDHIVGGILLSLLPPPAGSSIPRFSSADIRNILLIRPGGIGDFVLLLPAIRALQERYPAAAIDVLCETRNAGISALIPCLRRTYRYDRPLEFFDCLSRKYDAVVDTEQWYKLSAAVAGFIKAKIKIGFSTNLRSKAFTHAVAYNHEDYETRSFFNLISPLIGGAPEFAEGPGFVELENEFPGSLMPLPANERRSIIAIFPGASVPERLWECEKFIRVAETFRERGYAIVLVGSRKDAQRAQEIETKVPRCINLASRGLSLKETAAVLKASRILLTADSGLMHIAYAVNTPTVSLFGSGIEKKWAPRGKNHIVINKHLDCSPCTRFGQTPPCPIDKRCLSLIGADEVIDKMELLLRNTSGN